MLHFLRRSVRSVVAQILLGLLVVSFAIWGIGDIFTGTGEGTVAEVGDTEVSSTRYADALLRIQRTLSQQQRRAVSLAQLRESGIADATLAGLVRDAALQEELGRLGIAVPASAVREAIATNPAFQDGQGAFSQFLYQSRIGEAGYDPATFEAATRDSLGSQLLAQAVAPVIVAPPGVAETIAARRGETRSVEMVLLTPDMAPEPPAPDDAALQAFFEANQDRFIEPERRSGLYLHTDLDVLAQGTAPTDEEIRAEYEANQDRYTTEPAREVEQLVFADMATAEAAAARISAGEASFAEVAAEQNVSIGDLSLGRVTRADLPEATAETVFAATEPGVVGPVQGPFGPVLLNVTAVEPGGVAPFEQVADEIRAAIAERRALELVTDKANAIDDMRAGGTPLPEIAEQVEGIELVRFQGLDAQGDTQGAAAGAAPPPLARDPAFLAEVSAASEGEERDLIQLGDGSYALVMVEEIADSHLPELGAVRERVAAAWADEQRLQALEARAAELAARIAEEGLGPVAAEASLGEPQSISFTRETVPPELTAALADAAFAAEEGDSVVGRRAGGDAVLLGVLASIESLPEDQLAERTAALDAAIRQSLDGDQLEYFGRALEELHGATVNPDTIASVYDRLGQSGGN
jgi:peptidyl-prolyl cis-trans isomerase D